ncbi:MAG TPA: hypothetical protein VIW92_13025 [Thermoanaerobaculia bacterium]
MGSPTLRRLAWTLPVLAIVVAVVPRLAAGPSTVAAPVIDPAPFPPGFDYPQPVKTVEGWVQNRSGGRMRQHGWNLFAGLNQKTADGQLVWRTWYTSTQAFLYQYAGSGASPEPRRPDANVHDAEGVGGDPNLSVPGDPVYPVPQRVKDRYPGCVANDALIDGPTFQSNGDIMVAGVIYNDSAYKWILSKRLYDARVLSASLPAGRHDPAKAIAGFPHDSIVLKPMWWPVKGSGYTALPVWDSPPPSADGSSGDGLEGARYAGFEVQRLWKRAVAVTSDPTPEETTATVSFLHGVLAAGGRRLLGPNTYQAAPVVPLERFYHLTFSAADLAAMNRCDRALLDASAMWNYGRPFAAGDSLALIAMHIMTKEKPGWTFQTVWWHDQALACSTNPNSCNQTQDRPASYGSHRPANLGADTTWQNYFLVTTYGELQVPGNQNAWPPGEENQANKWPVAYNPYIELAATHPIATNCMNCHHRAAWPPRPAGGDSPGRHSSYLADGANAPDTQDVFTRNNAVFDGLLMLDSMWAVSDRAHSPQRGRGEQ